MIKIVLFILLSVSILFSNEVGLDDLLEQYSDSKELYLKTKNESAGHIIVFSRSDLDKMQAYTLNDILKTVRLFNIQSTNTGMNTLVKGGTTQLATPSVRLYINSHELQSVAVGSTLSQYGKMGLYFVDHVEIYQAASAISFGNEPSSMIIKLYTKNPSRENATSVQLSADTRGSSRFQAIDARDFDEYSYLANIDFNKINYKDYDANNHNLSRDKSRGQLYLNFSKKSSFDIELGATAQKHNIFNGLGSAPTSGEMKTNDGYIRVTKYFDNELKISLDASLEELDLYNKDDTGIVLSDNTISNNLEFKLSTHVYNVTIDKKFKTDKNELFLGLQYKCKKLNVDEFKSNNIDLAKAWGPTELDIYSVYLENMYNIDENNLLTFGVKIDNYKNNFSKSSTEHILRLGYVAILNNEWTAKVFLRDTYQYPIFTSTTFHPINNINPDLDATKLKMATGEITYKIEKTDITVGTIVAEAKDAMSFNMLAKKYVNNPSKQSSEKIFITTNYKFDVNNKVQFEYFKIYQDSDFSSDSGALVQLFNKIGKFNLYNELVYRSKYTTSLGIDMSAGYDYSLGITYPISKQMDLKLKGENIFDKASEVPINSLNIPVMERRALLTMEYTF